MADKQTGAGARGKQERAKGQKSRGAGNPVSAKNQSQQVKGNNRSSARSERTGSGGRSI